MTSPPSRLNPSFIFKATRAWWLSSFLPRNANWKTDSGPHHGNIKKESFSVKEHTVWKSRWFFAFLAIIVSREDALIRQDGLGNNEADLDEFYAKTQ